VEIDVFTLFPEGSSGSSPSATSPTRSRRAHAECVNYRDHTPLSGGQVDDTPFGGGAGMVLRVDVVEAALRATTASIRPSCGAAGA
jgi:tRNA (guanine37-N1)-methyltransferase